MPGTFNVDIVEPTGSIFTGPVERFRAQGVVGSFEILRDHAPLLAETAVGPVIVTTPDGNRIFFAAGRGFVQVANNRVIMLVEAAEPASEIDVERAKAAEKRARGRLREGSQAERRHAEAALERARNRLRVAMGQVGN